MARSVCMNNKTRAVAEDEMCDIKKKAPPRVAPCNIKPCPARYIYYSFLQDHYTTENVWYKYICSIRLT